MALALSVRGEGEGAAYVNSQAITLGTNAISPNATNTVSGSVYEADDDNRYLRIFIDGQPMQAWTGVVRFVFSPGFINSSGSETNFVTWTSSDWYVDVSLRATTTNRVTGTGLFNAEGARYWRQTAIINTNATLAFTNIIGRATWHNNR